MSYSREVPIEVWICVLERVPGQLSVDSGPVTLEPIRSGLDRRLGGSQVKDCPALLERQLPVALFHRDPPEGQTPTNPRVRTSG